MKEEIEAAGAAFTGGMIARVVEPHAGESGRGHGEVCLNCATALVGDYCHRCGQVGHVHRSLAGIWHDISHGVLHFEGKVWRTLPLLAVRPGILTRRYIAGERARFVSPMALFLFSVFLTFALISAFGGNLITPDIAAQADAQARDRVQTSRAQLATEPVRIDGDIAAAEAAGRDTDELRRERATVSGLLRFWEGGPSVLTAEGERAPFANSNTGWVALDKGIAKANANPNLLLYKLQANAYKFSWALIPMSAPFLALLFLWRRGHRLYDHAVFVTYSLAFMMLFAVALTLLGMAGASSSVLVPVALLIPPLHMYKQLRHAYALRRGSALWRTLALLIFAGVASLAFMLLLLALGLLA